jgi:hypothetical protein
MNLIGLAGHASSGKDTAADFLVERFGFVKVALADPMKRACAEWFGWSADTLWGPSENRNQPWPNLGGLTARKALQLLGTEYGRACYEDVWVDYAIRVAEAILKFDFAYSPTVGLNNWMRGRKPKGVVISDVRFPNEADAIRAAGGQVWRITRSPNDFSVDDLKWMQHSSETALDSWPDERFDAVIRNDDPIESLRATILATAIHRLKLEPRE